MDTPTELRSIGAFLEEVDLTKRTCIFFLIHSNRVVYVGKSTCIASAIPFHKQKRSQKGLDRVLFVEVPKKYGAKVERDLISVLRPKHNREGARPFPNYDYANGAAYRLFAALARALRTEDFSFFDDRDRLSDFRRDPPAPEPADKKGRKWRKVETCFGRKYGKRSDYND